MNTLLKVGFAACTALLAGCAPALQNTTLGRTDAAPGRLSIAQPASTVGAGGLTLSSPQFVNGGTLPLEQVGNSGGCTGGNVSPELDWSGVPAGTVSLVLTTYDPDAPTGSGLWHWVNYNIPASATSLPKGAGTPGSAALPAGTTVINNDPGVAGYSGACPPVGDAPHRYVFTLYALSKALTFPDGTRPPILGFNLNGAVLAKTSIYATYGR